jgi:hypothetical protein
MVKHLTPKAGKALRTVAKRREAYRLDALRKSLKGEKQEAPNKEKRPNPQIKKINESTTLTDEQKKKRLARLDKHTRTQSRENSGNRYKAPKESNLRLYTNASILGYRRYELRYFLSFPFVFIL